MALTIEQHIENADDFAEIAHRIHQIKARLRLHGSRYTREVDVLSALDPEDKRYAPSTLRLMMQDLNFDYQRLCLAMHASPEDNVYANLEARYQDTQARAEANPVADETAKSRKQKAVG